MHCSKEGVYPYALLALLSYPQTTKIYQSTTAQTGRVFAQVKKSFLEQVALPWPIDPNLRNELAELVKQAIESHDIEATEKLATAVKLRAAEAFKFS